MTYAAEGRGRTTIGKYALLGLLSLGPGSGYGALEHRLRGELRGHPGLPYWLATLRPTASLVERASRVVSRFGDGQAVTQPYQRWLGAAPPSRYAIFIRLR